MSTDTQHAKTTTCVGIAESDESDSDNDCPPLACASDMCSGTDGVHSDSAAVSAPVATVSATESSSTSSSSASNRADQAAQKQSLQQQPCVQCGKLTKKRCRRCQAVYYCSEQCQVLCFKDPEHRAQCDAAAVVIERQVA
jgi:sulfatase maturation enzyme AslB (radical SAM superfamily)